MVIPVLSGSKDLHESNATLDQAARNQATSPVILGPFPVDPVEAADRLGFSRNIEGLFGGLLHASGQSIAGQAGLEIIFTGMLYLVKRKVWAKTDH